MNGKRREKKVIEAVKLIEYMELGNNQLYIKNGSLIVKNGKHISERVKTLIKTYKDDIIVVLESEAATKEKEVI